MLKSEHLRAFGESEQEDRLFFCYMYNEHGIFFEAR